MSTPMTTDYSLDSRGTRDEISGRFLGKHFYAITGIRDWILSKRLQLQEIARTLRVEYSRTLSNDAERGKSRFAIHYANFHREICNQRR